MEIRIDKCTFVALENKRTYLSVFLAKTLSLFMIVTLLSLNVFQIFHSHDSNNHIEQSSAKAKISKPENCKVCDHYFHHHSYALTPDYSYPDFNVLVPKSVKGGIHLLGDYTCLVHYFSNKGPPAFA